MTKKLDNTRSERDVRVARTYNKEFGLAMALYVGTIVGTTLLGKDTQWKKWVFLVANFVPVLLIVRAVVRSLRRADEFERLIQLQALALGFGAAMLTSLAVAFSASAELKISPLLAGWAPFVVGMITWGGPKFAHRRNFGTRGK